VPLKSTGHHNTGTGPEKVKEEPMATVRMQEKKRCEQVFLVPYCSCGNMRGTKEVTENKRQESSPLFLFFSFLFFFSFSLFFFFLFFTTQNRSEEVDRTEPSEPIEPSRRDDQAESNAMIDRAR
jgi:hypothetical protein